MLTAASSVLRFQTCFEASCFSFVILVDSEFFCLLGVCTMLVPNRLPNLDTVWSRNDMFGQSSETWFLDTENACIMQRGGDCASEPPYNLQQELS